MEVPRFAKLIAEMDKSLQFPGVSNAWTMPIKARIDMLSTGIRTPVGVKVLGTDLGEMEKLARQIALEFPPTAMSNSNAPGRRGPMKLPILAALAIVTGTIATYADERPTTTPQALDDSLERRIENALRDLEIFNARALKVDPQATDGTLERRIEDALKDLESAGARTFKADEERLNALARKSGVNR